MSELFAFWFYAVGFIFTFILMSILVVNYQDVGFAFTATIIFAAVWPFSLILIFLFEVFMLPKRIKKFVQRTGGRR